MASLNAEEPDAKFRVPDDLWQIRTCSTYKEEYDDCRSLKGRFQQYYVNGSFDACHQWLQDYKDCTRYITTGDVSAAVSVISHEEERRLARLEAAKENNVWEYRWSPPADWNAPLPGQETDEKSLFAKADNESSETERVNSSEKSVNRCSLS